MTADTLFDRAEHWLRQLDAPVKFAERHPDSDGVHRTDSARERAADFRELLRLAKLASPELIALGEAAVKLGDDELQPGETFTQRSGRLDRARVEVIEAARAYAASVAEVKHE
jgi:hypothetical protein